MITIEKKDGKTIVTLDNGHAQALEKVTRDFQIVDEEKALGFILTVMRDANGKAVQTVTGSFVPAEQIKKQVIASIPKENGTEKQ